MNRAISWSGAFLLGMGTVLDIGCEGSFESFEVPEQCQLSVDPFHATGRYLSSAFLKDALPHIQGHDDRQLELFG